MLIKKNRKSLYIVSLLFVFVIFLSRCINGNEVSNDPRGIMYAEPSSCRKCHQAIYDSALLTAHFKASSPVSKNNMHGSFIAGHNTFVYDSITKMVMENRDSGMYQILYINGKEKEAHRFDIAFGLRNAQTFMFWKGYNLYELPLSYYTSVNDWGTSPGYALHDPYFKRIIMRECFECHSSNINTKKDVPIPPGGFFGSQEVTEALEKNSLIYGIDCQRCHGPAANHVNYHSIYPEIKKTMYMATSISLNTQQKIDMCAVCHSGNDKEKLRSRFYFKPGDTLSDFYLEMPGYKDKTDYDVHGNQQRLLSESKCFLQSKTMNCSTCHDPHKNAGNDLVVYSQKCMGCHSEAGNNFCTVVTTPGMDIKTNCIDCHMPKKPSAAISFYQQGKDQLSSYLLRTHQIAIYKTEPGK